MGDIKVVRGGFEVHGSTIVHGNLIVTDIASRDSEPIVFDSFNNFTINTRKGEEIINSFVLGKGGAIFNGSVQTPLVRTDSRNELSIESFARSIEILGAIGVALESRAGDLFASCLLDLRLQSTEGTIQLDAGQLYLKGLETAKAPESGKTVVSKSEIFQLCVCSNGKLFLAPPDGQCVFETDSNNVCK
uniref:Zeta-sarcoglycan n=1 Tax=Cacopsylla melanoneura TaxID=428564 RepID=A0A8D8QEK7_9HEMI